MYEKNALDLFFDPVHNVLNWLPDLKMTLDCNSPLLSTSLPMSSHAYAFQSPVNPFFSFEKISHFQHNCMKRIISLFFPNGIASFIKENTSPSVCCANIIL